MTRESKKAKRERAIEVCHRMEKRYGDVGSALDFDSPYTLLVAVMLSAQTTDRAVNKVTPELFSRWPGPAELASADVGEVETVIHSLGFYHSKARHAVELAQALVTDFGGEVPASMEELTSLPGVGRKTANVVMSNAFGVPAIAVDTHVFRVSNRLGLAEADDVLKTELQLQKAIPKKDWLDMHHRIIFHGRRVCKAQRPLCESCTLRDMCKTARSK